MPNFQLDGREIPFEPGDTIIRAAHRQGIEIPHYCWHPGLSVAANCRMCLVEIAPPPGGRPMLLDVLEWSAEVGDYVVAKKPKLQPACQMFVADGMVVKSDSSDEVARARAAVQELLLLNHPVDCPICDQAGECRLQDYWLEHQTTKKRMRDEPVHKPKAVVFGPTIVYDAERCILCTRCVRFCEEVAKDPVLDKRERGNLSEIVVSPGRQLDHDYTLMTEHVCPVGALTSRDFRFKARVWFLRSARTLCTGCATGCNAYLDFDPRTQAPARHRPRDNMAVNQYWMCDEGMLSYHRIAEGRVLDARVGGAKATVEAALAEAARLFAGVSAAQVAIVLGPQHASEDVFALVDLARRHLVGATLFVAGKPAGKGDSILMHEDKNPNRAGVAALAPEAKSYDDFVAAVRAGRVTHAIALGGHAPSASDALGKLAALVTLATHDAELTAPAHVVLPACVWAEAEGTFVNAKGVAQVSEKALEPRGAARPAWELVGRLGRALGFATDARTLKDLRRALAPAPAPSANELGA